MGWLMADDDRDQEPATLLPPPIGHCRRGGDEMVSTARTVRDALVPNRPATPGTGAGWRPFQASSEGGGDDRGRAPPAADQPVVFFSVSVMMMIMRQDTRRGQVLLGSRGVSFVRGRGGRLVLVLVLLQLAEFDRAISIGLGAFVSFYKMVQTLNLGFRHIFSGKPRKASTPSRFPAESKADLRDAAPCPAARSIAFSFSPHF